MQSRRRDLTRDPQRANLVRRVRATHRGYQRSGQTMRDLGRAEARDGSVFDLYMVLLSDAQSLLNHAGPKTTANVFHGARGAIRHRYPYDEQVRRDLRNIRFNVGSTPSARQVAQAVVDATERFKQDMANSKNASRRPKRRLRARAWADLNLVLSAIDVAFLAEANPAADELKVLTAGALH